MTLPLGDRPAACGLSAGSNVLVSGPFIVLSQQNTVPVPMELKLSATTALTKTKTEPGLQPCWTRWLHVNWLESCLSISENFADAHVVVAFCAGERQQGFSGKQAVFKSRFA